MLNLLWELIRKDLRQFVADKRALIISFTVPIAIASFMGMLFGGVSNTSPTSKIDMLVVDQDNSAVTQQAVAKLKAGGTINVQMSSLSAAQEAIRTGKSDIAIVYPKGFGDAARGIMAFGVDANPVLRTLVDPSHAIEAQAVRGAVMQATMGAIAGSDVHLPFEMKIESVTAANAQAWSGQAHAFAGMAIQGLLFWAVESAMIIMRERKTGIWNRLRAAPVPSEMLILGRLLSAALRSMMVIVAVLGFGMLVFGIRVQGSWLGLGLVAVAASLMCAAFGLFVAALGKTEAQSRGLTILAVLTMMMLGGGWYPTFLMPTWVQSISVFVPVHYAVDGLDAMTWRGSGLPAAISASAYMLVFVAVFGVIALRRFRFEAD